MCGRTCGNYQRRQRADSLDDADDVDSDELSRSQLEEEKDPLAAGVVGTWLKKEIRPGGSAWSTASPRPLRLSASIADVLTPLLRWGPGMNKDDNIGPGSTAVATLICISAFRDN
ncbi:hypothetical protein NMY22_g12069 [Coprinellus aureogranulatus]|nr:hypothetical protein NMY22_g12069 [Coprinellus aureogranulatus]